MNYNENNENNVNDVEDLNREEQQENVYVNPYVSQPQNEAWKEMHENREGFLKKHRFAFGILTGMVCVFLLLVGGIQLLKMTGQYFIIGGTGFHEIDNTPILDDATVDKLNEIYEWMKIYYYEDFDKSDIQGALFDGLIGGLDDPYSVYYTAEEYKDLMVSTSGEYYGIGAGLQQDPDTMKVTITKVYRGTPAEEAGLRDGDILISVEGIDATSMEVSALVQHIRGEEGTKVNMVIFRESTGETLNITAERRNVILPSIEGEMLEGGIGYIQILEFQTNTDEQFEEMILQLKKEGMKGILIDVRANPGGLLSSVVNMLDYVLPEGMLTYIEDKYGNRQEYRSDKRCLDMPIVILVDENSASASEIFAGAMKDYNYATLVGKTTFGKGIVQNIIPLTHGDAIKLTTARYYTPNGNYIHGVGVAPDVEVEYEYSGPLDQDYDKQYDSQFVKGLEELKKLMAAE